MGFSHGQVKSLPYISLVIWFFLLLKSSSCSQYALKWEQEFIGSEKTVEDSGSIQIQVPLSPLETRKLLLDYLRSRNRLETAFESKLQAGRFIILQPWIRDTSLRYIFIESGQRQRHLSEWKAQWTLEPAGNKSTWVTLDVLEVLFLGPIKKAVRPEITATQLGPDKPQSTDWFETPFDRYRSIAELRRFWMTFFLNRPLPDSIAAFQIKDPKFYPPKGKSLSEKSSNYFSRPAAF